MKIRLIYHCTNNIDTIYAKCLEGNFCLRTFTEFVKYLPTYVFVTLFKVEHCSVVWNAQRYRTKVSIFCNYVKLNTIKRMKQELIQNLSSSLWFRYFDLPSQLFDDYAALHFQGPCDSRSNVMTFYGNRGCQRIKVGNVSCRKLLCFDFSAD